MIKISLALTAAVALLSGCGNSEPLTSERYLESDKLFDQIVSNIESAPDLKKVIDIDHSRMGNEAGSEMPPSRVIMFSNNSLEAELVAENPLTAIDLPLRILAYEAEFGQSKVIYNSYDFLESRYQLSSNARLKELYTTSLKTVLTGVNPEKVSSFENDKLTENAVTTIQSPYDFETTLSKVIGAIESQDDTILFDQIDFQKNASTLSISTQPATLLLFGAPGPGAKAMSSAPTLGLDAFCQKFLVWKDSNDHVFLSYNNILELAERQNVSKSIALRFVSFRLNSVFEEALE